MASVSFFAVGLPSPAGSKNAVPIYKGKGSERHFTGRVAVFDAGGQRSKDFRQSVVQAAFTAMQKAGLKPFTAPLRTSFLFWMPRPANHHRANKRQNELRPDAPHWHTNTPDVLKMSRLVEDAMSGIVYVDDKLIAESRLQKIYVGGEEHGGRSMTTGCSITVTELD
jgi:Holliday junction resolvase RusA-like endonuclease